MKNNAPSFLQPVWVSFALEKTVPAGSAQTDIRQGVTKNDAEHIGAT